MIGIGSPLVFPGSSKDGAGQSAGQPAHPPGHLLVRGVGVDGGGKGAEVASKPLPRNKSLDARWTWVSAGAKARAQATGSSASALSNAAFITRAILRSIGCPSCASIRGCTRFRK